MQSKNLAKLCLLFPLDVLYSYICKCIQNFRQNLNNAGGHCDASGIYGKNRIDNMEACSIKPLKVWDRNFEVLIPHDEIIARIDALAARINADFSDRKCIPLFVGVLNGSFMFCAELVQRVGGACEVSFVKLSSYEGFSSSGTVTELIGLREDVRGRDVIIVEDIVETGASIAKLIESLRILSPASINVAALVLKPEAYKQNYEIRYCAFEVPDDFIIGFGMDYNGLARNLRDIYRVTDEQ